VAAGDSGGLSPLLVARAQTGDREALDRVLRALQGPLYRHVLGLLGDADAARDALQDVLLIVYRKMGRVRDPRWFRAWAYRVATREALRRARRERGRPDAALLADPAPYLDAAEQLVPDEAPHAELLARLPELLDALSPASAVVLRMHYVDGLTHPEIAEALELSVGTVKSRLAYGLTRLRRRIGVGVG
jgi:RNA polymerase sigma-70 factor, ECF subfamily